MRTYEQYVRHGLASYLSSYRSYHRHRIRYYADVSRIDPHHLNPLSIPFSAESELSQRLKACRAIADSRSSVIIATSTKNRAMKLRHAYAKLHVQKFTDWQWLIVDNGSDDDTEGVVASFNDPRILYTSYTEATGCAYPVRNCAFDIIATGLHDRHVNLPWTINLDSDDHLYDEFSLAEIHKTIQKSRGEKTVPLFSHGLAAWRTEGVTGVEMITCPSDTYKDFPLVPKVQFLFDRGLTVLAGAYSPQAMAWLRYPREFSFEDNGLNAKLILQSNKQKLRIHGIDYPVVAKNDSDDNMIAKNNAVGDKEQVEYIGGHKATGVRARIVRYLNTFRVIITKVICKDREDSLYKRKAAFTTVQWWRRYQPDGVDRLHTSSDLRCKRTGSRLCCRPQYG